MMKFPSKPLCSYECYNAQKGIQEWRIPSDLPSEDYIHFALDFLKLGGATQDQIRKLREEFLGEEEGLRSFPQIP